MLVSNRLGLLRLKICSGSCALVALDSAKIPGRINGQPEVRPPCEVTSARW